MPSSISFSLPASPQPLLRPPLLPQLQPLLQALHTGQCTIQHTGQCTVQRTDLHRTGHVALALTALATELALVAYLWLATQTRG